VTDSTVEFGILVDGCIVLERIRILEGKRNSCM